MDLNNIKKILAKVKEENRKTLDLMESREVLKALKINLDRAEIAEDRNLAREIAKRIGFPVAMKIVSPDILHKTEAGGVVLNITDENMAEKAYTGIIESAKRYKADAHIKGVLIEEMLSGNELIVGTVKDPLFMDMIMFGIGGVLVELYRDVTFRLIPVRRVDILEMFEEIKAKEILNGYRKSPPVDREELIRIIQNISRLVESHTEIESIEINPLIITQRGLIAIDARVILRE